MLSASTSDDADRRDQFDLDRFLLAQESQYAQALAELQSGRKRTHWMWYVLPQLKELGESRMAHQYGLASIEEARAYLAHPVLGPRLDACVEALLALHENNARVVLGFPDDLKLRSCATLFGRASASSSSIFARLLEKYFGGVEDPETVRLLGAPT